MASHDLTLSLDQDFFSVDPSTIPANLNRVGKADPRSVGQYGFRGALDAHHVDDADHFSPVHFEKRAATVFRIGGSVQLMDLG